MGLFPFQWAVRAWKARKPPALLCLSDSVIFKEFMGKSVFAEKWLAWLTLTHKTPGGLEKHFNA